MAHPLVDEGVAAYAEGRFAHALQSFAEAEAGDDLSVDDLITLYAHRSLVSVALGNDFETDLRRLVSIDPNHVLGAAYPPPVRESFRRLRRDVTARLNLEVDVRTSQEEIRLAANVVGDNEGLVREVYLYVRTQGNTFDRTSENTVTLTNEGNRVEYYALAVGPGGAPVARVATAEAPRAVQPLAPVTLGSPDPNTQLTSPPAPDSDEGTSHRGLWIGVGVSAGVAVAVATVLAIVLRPAPRGMVSAPEPE